MHLAQSPPTDPCSLRVAASQAAASTVTRSRSRPWGPREVRSRNIETQKHRENIEAHCHRLGLDMFLCFYVSVFLCFYVSLFLCFYVSAKASAIASAFASEVPLRNGRLPPQLLRKAPRNGKLPPQMHPKSPPVMPSCLRNCLRICLRRQRRQNQSRTRPPQDSDKAPGASRGSSGASSDHVFTRSGLRVRSHYTRQTARVTGA